MSPVDWVDWHRAYADPASPLHRRLRLVRAHIRAALDATPPPLDPQARLFSSFRS